jgi:hypothetical protein
LGIVEEQLRQPATRAYPEVSQLVTQIQVAMNRQTEELEVNLASLGGEQSSLLRTAMGAVARVASDVIVRGEGSGEKSSKILRNDYAALETAAIGSMMLHTTALAMNHSSTADLTQRHFQELASLANEIRSVIPQVVVREFADEGYTVDPSVTEGVSRSIQESSWSRLAA